MAEEEPDTYVLNYAPGPLLTDMAKELQNGGYMRKFFRQESNLLKPEDSVAKLLRALKTHAAPSGAHLDVYDIE